MIPSPSVILVVDDEPHNIRLIQDALCSDHTILVAKNGAQALERALQAARIDLILLDIMMPGMDGLEVCRRLKEHSKTRDIPVIFVTAMVSAADEARGLELGAVDYLSKPVSIPVLKARVSNSLIIKQASDLLVDRNRELERLVGERTRELAVTRDATILCMATLAEIRDSDTGNHIRRTREYVRALAVRLKSHPDFAPQLTHKAIQQLYEACTLHDIGKIGIPDSVLTKAGRLDPHEVEAIRKHPVLGHEAISTTVCFLQNNTPGGGSSASFLSTAAEIAHLHHEKWDGSGYPQGLAGEAIPLSARIMALADVYDALITRRPYKEPLSHRTACGIICDGSGNHFDPRVVEAFLAIESEFASIAERFGAG